MMQPVSGTILCFGEVVMRLSVRQGELPLQSGCLQTYVGGAEANVAVALASLGVNSRLVSAIPAGAVGDGVIGELRRHGVDVSAVLRPAGRLGLYYHLPTGPMRLAEVIYDRSGSAFAQTAPGDWDWERQLADAAWLHVSGVTPALGPNSAEAVREAVTRARAAGIGVSFDGNWRGRLWERWQSDPSAILRPIVAQATVLFANHRDAALLLGRPFAAERDDQRRAAALALLEAFPSLEYVASTAREIVAPDHHRLTARIDNRTNGVETGPVTIMPILDRIGTGDAFAAAVLDGLWRGLGPAGAAANGLALSGLKHGLHGDFAPFSRSALENACATAQDIAR